jgi:hypothetical protein
MKYFRCMCVLLALFVPAWSQGGAKSNASLTNVSAGRPHPKRHQAHKTEKHAKPKHRRPGR